MAIVGIVLASHTKTMTVESCMILKFCSHTVCIFHEFLLFARLSGYMTQSGLEPSIL
jgi:hypothetical protein